MNIFVLCTGRCGSATFIEACAHIENYSAAHESRLGRLGKDRVSYSGNHIEADNRLSWHLGRLEQAYGDDAFYVHLKRDPVATAKSFQKRYEYIGAIMPAYEKGILMNRYKNSGSLEVCLDYCDTINTNISAFLETKTKKMEFHLENAAEDFTQFWQRINASGNLDVALAEWKVKHNPSLAQTPPPQRSIMFRLRRKAENAVSRFIAPS